MDKYSENDIELPKELQIIYSKLHSSATTVSRFRARISCITCSSRENVSPIELARARAL